MERREWGAIVIFVLFVLVSVWVFYIPTLRTLKRTEETAHSIDQALAAYCRAITESSTLTVTTAALAPCQEMR